MLPAQALLRPARLHRWAALLLMPVFLVLLTTGALLCFAPWARPGDPADRSGRVDPLAVRDLLQRVDAEGRAVFVALQADRRSLTILKGPGEAPTTFDLRSGAPLPTPPEPPLGFFDRVAEVHRNLWPGLGALTGIASFAMLLLVLSGPFLARPERSGSLGLHRRAGWALWPLLLLLPGSWLMLKLHRPLGAGGSAPALSLVLERASASHDLGRFRAARRLGNGQVLLFLEGAEGMERYRVTGGQVEPLDTGLSRLGRRLHEGRWGGPWGRVLNLAAVAAFLPLMATGLASWLGRRGSKGLAA